MKSVSTRLFITAFFFAILFAGNANAKPLAPIGLSLQADAPVIAGSTASFTLTGRNFSLEQALVIHVQLPSGWTLLDGALDWQGTIAKGKETTLHFTVAVPANGVGKIAAAMHAQQEAQSQFRAEDFFSLAATTSRALKSTANNTRTVYRYGRPLREVKLP